MNENDPIVNSIPQSRVEEYLRAALLKDKTDIPLPQARIDYYLIALIDAIIAGSGAKDHDDLTGRDKTNQHPMSAITGLIEALSGRPIAKIFHSYEEMIAYMNAEDDETQPSLLQSQSVIITNVDVPDVYIGSVDPISPSIYTYTTDEAFITDLDNAASGDGLQVGWYHLYRLESDWASKEYVQQLYTALQYLSDDLYMHKFADTASAGQVLTADGEGGASYEDLPDMSAGIAKIVTIPVSAWEPVTGGYEAEITIEGITADNSVIVEGDVKAVSQAANSLTFFSEELVSTDQIVKVVAVNTTYIPREYNISATVQNVIAQSSNPTIIAEGRTATLTFTANGTSYKVPTTAPTVTGATATYNRVSDTECTITLSNATGNVSFEVVGESIPWSETNLTGTTWEISRNIRFVTRMQYERFSLSGTWNFAGYSASVTAPYNYMEINHYSSTDTCEFMIGVSSNGSINTTTISTPTACGYQNVYSHTMFNEWRWLAAYGSISNGKYRTVTDNSKIRFYISGGADTTNSTLISWFKANADLISW